MTKPLMDTVYYWVGGSERGEWRPTLIAASEIDATLERLRRAGYCAVKGSTAIGAPEGAPQS